MHLREAVARAAQALVDEALRAAGSRPLARGGALDRADRDLASSCSSTAWIPCSCAPDARRSTGDPSARALRDSLRRRSRPVGLETSAYEHAKYEHTLAALGDRRYARASRRAARSASSPRCSLHRCEALLAVDIAQTAVDAARERLAAHDHVRIERRTLPGEWPAGPFDLVVCSELLYYWDRPSWRQALPVIAESLAPGGRLVAVH